MANTTVVKALSNFFNVDTMTAETDPILFAHNGEGEFNPKTGAGVIGIKGKQPVGTWGDELKKFTPAEKRALAELVVAVTGDTLPEIKQNA